MLLESKALCEKYEITHINLSFEGKSSLRRIALTIHAILDFCKRLAFGKSRILHLMTSRTKLGFIKDFILVNLASLARIRTVSHVHGGDLQLFYQSCGPLLKRIVRSIYSKIDCAIALGPSLRKQFCGLVPDERVRVVFNCYPHDGDTIGLRARGKRSQGRLRVLFLSNVLPSKGLFDAVGGVAMAQKRGVPVEFSFAGQFLDFDLALERDVELRTQNLPANVLEGQFSDYVGTLHLNGNVHVLGVVSGSCKWELLQNSDILLLPIFNPTEGQPLTVIEAMRAGCAVVSTTCGGLVDLVEDGVTGIVVKSRCPSDIGAALEYFWRHPDRMSEIGQNNQRRALELYSPEAHAKNISSIYEDLLSEPAGKVADISPSDVESSNNPVTRRFL